MDGTQLNEARDIAAAIQRATGLPIESFKIRQKSNTLHILITRPSSEPLDYSTLTPAIQSAIAPVLSPKLETLSLYSRAPGQKRPDWSEHLILSASPSSYSPTRIARSSAPTQVVSPPSRNARLSAASPMASSSTTLLAEDDLDLSQYSFVRSQRMLTADLPAPPEAIASAVVQFHNWPSLRKQEALKLLERFFRAPARLDTHDLATGLQNWIGELQQLNEQKQRTAAIWFTRYCQHPDATIETLGGSGDSPASPPPRASSSSASPPPRAQASAPIDDDSQTGLANYCFVGNRRLLNADLPAPTEEIIRSLQTFHNWPEPIKWTVLPVLEAFFSSPSQTPKHDLPFEQQQWLQSLASLKEQKLRSAAIWFSRYCNRPESVIPLFEVSVLAARGRSDSRQDPTVMAYTAGAKGNRRTLWEGSANRNHSPDSLAGASVPAAASSASYTQTTSSASQPSKLGGLMSLLLRNRRLVGILVGGAILIGKLILGL
ncbi:hypothetical protein [Synechococcus sp. PCC 7336]|uniref:hypothetical protein n=1 Tax=Synechococcus sp. PCC 7336 TaxID=195250 RepID=UPI000345FC32|nr:hypothetical protein [Synechococcus sp. PCC 7336]